MGVLRLAWHVSALMIWFAITARGQLILPPPVMPDAIQGQYYSSSVSSSSGFPPWQGTLLPGSSLPQGLQLVNSFNGPEIDGAPQVFGQFSFSIQVTDGSSPPLTKSRQFTITIHQTPPPPFQFLSTSLPDAVYGAPYGPVTLVTGGTFPYYGYIQGVLSFDFDRNGSLETDLDVFDTVGTHQVTIYMTDSSVPAKTISQTFNITVKVGLELAPYLLDGTVFQTYSDQVFVAAGGTAPYTYQVTSGALPPGLQLNNTTGAVTGTPTKPGTFDFTVVATDSLGVTGSQAMSIQVYGLTISANPNSLYLPTGQVGVMYPTFTYSFQAGSHRTQSVSSAEIFQWDYCLALKAFWRVRQRQGARSNLVFS